mmetsp:Transcript_4013/g.10221  ORF Transcript_4013/g.10221 Transcript_4013/m.10221 type:complete len:347 (+) Transcript_4013:510-1550(+)
MTKSSEMLTALMRSQTASPVKAEQIRCFTQRTVGSFSCHGMAPVDGEATAKINQDCGCFVNPFAWPGQALFAVFDGHGPEGEVVSNAAMSNVFELLADDLRLELDTEAAMVGAFDGAELALRKSFPAEALHSGAVAVAVLLRLDKIFIAGAGDCRCVLARKRADGGFDALDLSVDHNFENASERERVLAAGGELTVSKDPKVDGYFEPARVYHSLETPWLGPGLAMSRSIGDFDASEVGVVATPQVRVHTLAPEDEFLILASDGVWEFIESAEAVEIVGSILKKGWSAEAACKHLIARAAVEWMQEEGDYRDDITCIIVYLSCLDEMRSEVWRDYGIEDEPVDAPR